MSLCSFKKKVLGPVFFAGHIVSGVVLCCVLEEFQMPVLEEEAS